MKATLRKSFIVTGLPLGSSEPDIAFVIRVGTGRWIANGTVLR